jgi:hypothetical protein
VDRSSFGNLLATTSVAALLIAAAGPAMAGSCTPVGAGFTNSGAITCITVTNTSFAGNVSNNGTISAGSAAGTKTAIAVTGSTIAGSIFDSGTIRAPSGLGIAIDGTSKIPAPSFEAISVVGPNFSGGISNAGALVGTLLVSGVPATTTGVVTFMSSFGGGITNSGTISGGLAAVAVSSFAGGISNSGTIAGSLSAITAGNMKTFSGGIVNSGTLLEQLTIDSISTFNGGVTNTGTISAANGGGFSAGIDLNNMRTFNGGITNAGDISATGSAGNHHAGIRVGLATTLGFQGVASFSGNISNSGTITALTSGIALGNVSAFAGEIVNSGRISAATGILIQNTPSVSVFDSGTIIGGGGTAVQFGAGTNTMVLAGGWSITGNVVRGRR